MSDGLYGVFGVPRAGWANFVMPISNQTNPGTRSVADRRPLTRPRNSWQVD